MSSWKNALWIVALAVACAGPNSASNDNTGDDASVMMPGDDQTMDSGMTSMDASTNDVVTTDVTPQRDSGMIVHASCRDEPPPGAPQADPLPTYAGQCPMIAANPATTTIMSSGNARTFILVVPANLQPNEKLPVVFFWHWLKGSPSDFIDRGELQSAADEQRFLGVVPAAKGDLKWTWPFSVADTDARLHEDVQFFDDMLACVAAQYPTVNKNCVGSVGVSAGALFTDQLAGVRSNRLSSILSLSGGVGGIIRNWGNPPHKMPAIVLWGGPTDGCFGLLNFQTESQSLETALASDGNFFVECIHNCGHAEPPINSVDGGPSRYAGLWGFIFDHPFWLGPGQSPYAGGLPSTFPAWCGIGKGSATPRTGPCPPPGC